MSHAESTSTAPNPAAASETHSHVLSEWEVLGDDGAVWCTCHDADSRTAEEFFAEVADQVAFMRAEQRRQGIDELDVRLVGVRKHTVTTVTTVVYGPLMPMTEPGRP